MAILHHPRHPDGLINSPEADIPSFDLDGWLGPWKYHKVTRLELSQLAVEGRRGPYVVVPYPKPPGTNIHLHAGPR